MARGGLGGCFPGFPSSPTRQRAAGRDRDPAPDAWVLRAAPHRVCVAPEGRRWGVGSGEASAQPTFSPPVHFSHFLPGRGRGLAGDGGGDSGENSLTRPAAAHCIQ